MQNALGFCAPGLMVYVKNPLRWEYQQVVRDLGAGQQVLSADELNTWGQDGWELVCAVSLPPHVVFYLKREQRA